MNFHTAGGEDYYENMRRECSKNQYSSPIPPHLSDEELEEWIHDLEYEKKERKRRKEQGMYPYGSTRKSKTKLKKSRRKKK